MPAAFTTTLFRLFGALGEELDELSNAFAVEMLFLDVAVGKLVERALSAAAVTLIEDGRVTTLSPFGLSDRAGGGNGGSESDEVAELRRSEFTSGGVTVFLHSLDSFSIAFVSSQDCFFINSVSKSSIVFDARAFLSSGGLFVVSELGLIAITPAAAAAVLLVSPLVLVLRRERSTSCCSAPGAVTQVCSSPLPLKIAL